MALSNEDLGGRPGILFLCRRRWRRGPPWARPRRSVPPEKTDPSGGAPGSVGKPGRTQTLQEDGDGVGRIFREPVNGLTHAVGALFSAVALVVLVREAVALGPMRAVVGGGSSGASRVPSSSARARYRLLLLAERGISMRRRLDHAMMYVPSAGTYSPVLLGALGGPS